MIRTCLSITAAALLLGCASVDSVGNADASSGEEHVFNADFISTVEAVTESLPALGVENIEVRPDNATTTVFLGSVGITPASWGEVVRVIVTALDPEQSSVRVYWRHKFRDGPVSFAPNWEKKIFASLSERLPVK